MPNLDQFHPRPCAACGHRNKHGEVSGCIANLADVGKPAQWCPCDTWQDTRPAARPHAEGTRRAEAGGALALTSSDEWRTVADKRIVELIGRGTDFTAEDVTDTAGMPPHRNAVGGLFQRHKAAMVTVGYAQASRPEAHARVLRVWKGKAEE